MVNYAINIYERGFDIMEKNGRKSELDKNSKNNQTQENAEQKTNLNNGISITIDKKSLIIFVISFTTIIVLAILGVGKYWATMLWNLNGDFKVLQNDVAENKKNLEDINEKTESTNDIVIRLEEKNKTFESELNGFKNTQNSSTIVYVPTQKMGVLISSSISNKNDSEFLSSPQWNDNDIIAKNENTGRKYKPKDLKDKKILFSYSENGQDIYFYGQFNKYNHWDGNCIINVYKNNKLQMIMDGQYTDGNLISYKQVIHYKNTHNIKVWSISEREVIGNINTGETYTYYFKTKNNKSNFNRKNVEASDILSVIDFRNWLNTSVEGYYYGNTSGGKYNDDSGQAYLLKYNKKGNIRLFYYGNFKDGRQEDSTDNAWDIVLGKDGKYYYRKSHYSQDKINYDSMTDHKDALSGSEAETILKEKLGENFKNLENKCVLSWNEK